MGSDQRYVAYIEHNGKRLYVYAFKVLKTSYHFTEDLHRATPFGDEECEKIKRLDKRVRFIEVVKLSTLPGHTYLEYRNKIVSKKYIDDLIRKGEEIKELYTVNQLYISNILRQAYQDSIVGIDREIYSAPNKGKLVIVDYDRVTKLKETGDLRILIFKK